MRVDVKKFTKKFRFSLTITLSLFAFCILVSAIGLAALGVYILSVTGAITGVDGELQTGTLILLMLLISVILGAVMAFFGSRIPLKPLNNFINKINQLASGDFKARLNVSGAMSKNPSVREITESFNKLAEELENTEMLRGDFINNFSHEFKTPIVSIAGFAKLLNRGNLSEEERKSYLKSIEEESMRLSYMATNVLNLTKVENQSILRDVTTYNLSEQLRSAVLLLEGKWEKKGIELAIDLEEYTISANEELLKEVWINLIDNAIKFSNEGGTVSISIKALEDTLDVSIRNTGETIPPEKQEKIFAKFYQADESHSTEGNGIGLAIVKKIVELHQGGVSLNSEAGETEFKISLPKRQEIA